MHIRVDLSQDLAPILTLAQREGFTIATIQRLAHSESRSPSLRWLNL